MSKTVFYRSYRKVQATRTNGTNTDRELGNHIRESVPENEAITRLSVRIKWLSGWTWIF